MSQLARECNIHLITLRYQTIYEKIIFILYLYETFVYKIYLFLEKNLYLCNSTRNISSLTSNQQDINRIQTINKLNPYYITGFVDGEGCFLINIVSRSNQILGFNINLVFKIKLHSRDIELIKMIRNTLGQIGNITIRKDGYVEFIVSYIKDIEILIKHFESYPLLTQKWSDYQLFKQTFILIKNKEHLNMEGLKKIVSLKSGSSPLFFYLLIILYIFIYIKYLKYHKKTKLGVALPYFIYIYIYIYIKLLNNGLPEKLKIAFPDTISATRPKAPKPIIQDPH
jgi:hypothetical protein